MEELRFNSNGTDARYMANTNMFFSVLYGLEIFRNGWPEEKLGSQSVLQKCTDWFRQMFEGGLTGNRLNIAARKAARQELDLRIQKILHYLAVMADEADLTALLNSGVVTLKTGKRNRKTAKSVAKPA
ncbi:hypothetical protein [Geomonas oryzae]|uniref:hypothetical protein n=1 Tax=Geomonas oryzae TaxID=2364273 RepID=UPI00100BA60E|nr:hypothetical protein [Geomonas oryzae]